GAVLFVAVPQVVAAGREGQHHRRRRALRRFPDARLPHPKGRAARSALEALSRRVPRRAFRLLRDPRLRGGRRIPGARRLLRHGAQGPRALRVLYFSLAESYLHPPAPKLHNTDGEPLEPRTLYFDVDSAHNAFEALAPLALGHTREELLSEAKLDAAGAVLEASIPWIRRNEPKASLETVVLGHLRIEDRTLTVEVNSAAR